MSLLQPGSSLTRVLGRSILIAILVGFNASFASASDDSIVARIIAIGYCTLKSSIPSRLDPSAEHKSKSSSTTSTIHRTIDRFEIALEKNRRETRPTNAVDSISRSRIIMKIHFHPLTYPLNIPILFHIASMLRITGRTIPIFLV